MDPLERIQELQLKLIESASVSESCARDLMDILCNLSTADARSVRGIVKQLRDEAFTLRGLSKEVTANHFFVRALAG
jgi:hypothetical protein